MKHRIGLMGGTFNPIHNGHLLLAQEAKEQYDLEQVWFLPARRPPHKDNDELPKDKARLAMLKLAIEDNPAFIISMLEMQRTDGKTYTYETFRELNRKYPSTEFYFIIGSDSLFYLHKWSHFEELLHGMVFLVALRGGETHNQQEMEELIAEYKEKYQARIDYIKMPLVEISSTLIREKAENELTVKYYLPDKVEEYIRAHHIYGEEDLDCH